MIMFRFFYDRFSIYVFKYLRIYVSTGSNFDLSSFPKVISEINFGGILDIYDNSLCFVVNIILSTVVSFLKPSVSSINTDMMLYLGLGIFI